MEFHVLDLVSASKLWYTINALDLPLFSSLSYRGHRKVSHLHYFSVSLCPFCEASLDSVLRNTQYFRGHTAYPDDTLSSSLNIPCQNANVVVPAKGSLLFLCCSVLLHLMATITSLCNVFSKMTICNLSASAAVSLATDCLQLSGLSSAGVCSLC